MVCKSSGFRAKSGYLQGICVFYISNNRDNGTQIIQKQAITKIAGSFSTVCLWHQFLLICKIHHHNIPVTFCKTVEKRMYYFKSTFLVGF